MKRLLVITYWSYPDALIQTYTLPYLRLISKNLPEKSRIFLVTLEKERLSENQAREAEKTLNEINATLIPFSYHPFGLKAMISQGANILSLLALCFRKKITHIHAWCTPAGAMGYLLSVLTGKPLILDSFEPHAETMVETGTWKADSMAFKLLFRLERLQAHKAHKVIGTTAAMQEYSKSKYGANLAGMLVKPACVDLSMFSIANRKNKALVEQFGLQNKIVGIYAGKFGGIYLEKEIFDFFRVAQDFWKDRFHLLLLTGHTREEVDHFAQRAGIDPAAITVQFVAHKDVPDYMGLGDFGVTPVKRIPSKRYCTPIKDGEYWALGLPVVITKDISDDSGIIEEHHIGAVLQGLDNESYLDAARKIDRLLSGHSIEDLYGKIRPVAERYRNFSIAEKVYQQIYGS